METDQRELACLPVQQFCPVSSGRDSYAVDPVDHRIPVHMRAIYIEGPSRDHFFYPEPIAFFAEVVQQSQGSRLISIGKVGSISSAGMGAIQLAQQLTEQYLEIIVVIDIGQELLVEVMVIDPVHALKVRVEEFLFDLLPGMFEDVSPLCRCVEFHLRIDLNRGGLAVLCIHFHDTAARQDK